MTSHDVARTAGVSQSTVSRAMRRDPKLASATHAKVLEAARKLGYTPNHIGRSLVTRLTRTIGIGVSDLSTPVYHHLIGPLHDELARHGYRMILMTEPPNSADGSGGDQMDWVLDRSVDGLVLITTNLDATVPAELSQRNLPFVFLVRTAEGVAADCSIVDNSLGGSLMGAELIRQGHRQIGAILGPSNTSTGRDRERGLRAALKVAGVELRPEHVGRGAFAYPTGYSEMVRIMTADHPPTAIFCGDDTIAFGALNAARQLGLAVPQDVSVVGFDDLPQAAWEVFELTTVHQPTDEMARTAVRLLIARLEGGDAKELHRIVFEPTVVTRRTLGPPRSGGLNPNLKSIRS